MFGINSESDGDEGKKVDIKVGIINVGLFCKVEVFVDVDDLVKIVLGIVKVGVCKESSEGIVLKLVLLDELVSDVWLWFRRVGEVEYDIGVCFVVRVVLIFWIIVVRNFGDGWEVVLIVIDMGVVL